MIKKINQIQGSRKVSIAAVDLFCGIGGLTYGLNKAGIKVVAGVDINKKCKFAFEENNNALFINKSIKEIPAEEILNLYPAESLKVLVGCAPCQPFSKHTYKNRDRKEKENWGLLYDFLEKINKVKPVIVSMENVPQITKHKVFSDFVEGLVLKNYNVNWQNVYCPDYGIPQIRTRLVLLASKLGPIKLLPKTTEKTDYKTVKDTIGNMEPIKAGETSSKDSLHRSSNLSKLNRKRMRQSKPGGTWRDWDKELLLECHKRDTGKSYGSVYGRMKWNKPSPTITTQFYNYGTGRFGHPEQDRAISIREGAILQTFPSNYKFVPSTSPVLFTKLGKYIGNAVPVRLGEMCIFGVRP